MFYHEMCGLYAHIFWECSGIFFSRFMYGYSVIISLLVGALSTSSYMIPNIFDMIQLRAQDV